jgi:hypothetical protein
LKAGSKWSTRGGCGMLSQPSYRQPIGGRSVHTCLSILTARCGVSFSYLVDSKEPPSLEAELLGGLRDEMTREKVREALRMPERERKVVLGIMRQFGPQSGMRYDALSVQR